MPARLISTSHGHNSASLEHLICRILMWCFNCKNKNNFPSLTYAAFWNPDNGGSQHHKLHLSPLQSQSYMWSWSFFLAACLKGRVTLAAGSTVWDTTFSCRSMFSFEQNIGIYRKEYRDLVWCTAVGTTGSEMPSISCLFPAWYRMSARWCSLNHSIKDQICRSCNGISHFPIKLQLDGVVARLELSLPFHCPHSHLPGKVLGFSDASKERLHWF